MGQAYGSTESRESPAVTLENMMGGEEPDAKGPMWMTPFV